MKTTVTPLFKWTGSKQRLLEQYAPHFFPNKITRFVDLFAGALTTTLWVEQWRPGVDFVINDFNSELIHLYQTLVTNENEVITEWRKCVSTWLPLSKEDRKKFYYELREEYCHKFLTISDTRMSGILLFMMQVNFNGMWLTYKNCNNRYSTAPGTCTQGVKFFDESRIRRVSYVLKKCTITNGDFENVDVRDGDYIYADPPYRDSAVDYQGGFIENDQVRLAKFLTSHNGDFAYSNKEIGDDFYEVNFPGCKIHKIFTKYTAGYGDSVIDAQEVLITNF